MLSELQFKAELGSAQPSDEVEGLKFEVKWEPMNGMVGIVIDQDESMEIIGELLVVGLCELGMMKPHACPLGIEQPRFRGNATQCHQYPC